MTLKTIALCLVALLVCTDARPLLPGVALATYNTGAPRQTALQIGPGAVPAPAGYRLPDGAASQGLVPATWMGSLFSFGVPDSIDIGPTQTPVTGVQGP
ncbi:hypothetical protein MNEG_10518 [Monoraphidium neglectum]|uniref:Uncharacterized protein n=1 Tax=Monoraphidium neglectum TaxID=145388 RepID=A0A0D2KP71_9CHLO|nr:hypothetical protein MNEG_10518 [Monoraphidium neglectum]KIY97443.1 hypothetical protein MNEG_10518 [Monoraphidium neglectum]|eukprot:XP_013896463.1 hypothetical protein MNEG_10518 [Monoraphidium neglectum]